MTVCCANCKHEWPGERPADREQVATVGLHGEDGRRLHVDTQRPLAHKGKWVLCIMRANDFMTSVTSSYFTLLISVSFKLCILWVCGVHMTSLLLYCCVLIQLWIRSIDVDHRPEGLRSNGTEITSNKAFQRMLQSLYEEDPSNQSNTAYNIHCIEYYTTYSPTNSDIR